MYIPGQARKNQQQACASTYACEEGSEEQTYESFLMEVEGSGEYVDDHGVIHRNKKPSKEEVVSFLKWMSERIEEQEREQMLARIEDQLGKMHVRKSRKSRSVNRL